MAFFASLATFTTFAALVLQIFTLIGNTYNKPFLRDLFFARLYSGSSFVDFGLWNYCTGSGSTVSSCSTPMAAFDWTTAPAVDSFTESFHGTHNLFLANFILYWIAFGLTLLALVVTLMSHFKRSSDVCASLMCFLAFIVMLVVFIIILVVSIKGVNAAKSASGDATGYLGPSVWMSLGAMVGLFFSSIWYCISCFFGSGRVRALNKA
ncbi:actin cortical patch SUR7/pH-response regulator pali [Gongronella butleri]|nr:actin cortical patch SUR7/pH-response regulator pali [Gongronella butleri]